ncbi:MAG: hypothetical protein JJU29_12470 [Verrucomicrobia bacterium]|nr:hypothetical protein [Verrucomicrobiota bacterium]MCH8512911.1 hypothetical protein [Kiritimatiellia bacterium]
MARSFEVKRNNEHLYWSIGLLILCLWCIRDGWFPPESKIEKYPDVPTETWSLALGYEFYRFNRVTAIITGIASGVLLVMYRLVNR